MSSSRSILLRRLVWLATIAALSTGGVLVVLYCTVWGAALSDDSYHYIRSARDLLSGHGLTLTPHFAPVLPLVLGGIGLVGVDPLDSIRWLNAFLFGVNIVLVGWILLLLTQSRAFSALGASMFLVSGTLIEAHAWAMSEPLYLFFSLLGLLVFFISQDGGHRSSAFLTGLVWGVAAGTRYVGASLLLAGTSFWATEAGRSHRERLQNALCFSVIGLAPILAWFARNQLLTERLTSRALAWHPPSGDVWLSGLNTMLLWLAPGRLVNGNELVWSAVIGAVLAVGFLWAIVRGPRQLLIWHKLSFEVGGVVLISLSLLSYWIVLILSRSLLDERIPMDGRLLAPVLVCAGLLLVSLVAVQWRTRGTATRSLILVLLLAVFGTNTIRSLQTIQSYHQNGRGYASARDHVSETYAYLRNRPRTPIYSNAPAAIYFWTGRDSDPIPLPGMLPVMKAEMQRTGAYLVVFDSIALELYGTTRTELTAGLVEEIRLSEATIYRSP